GEWCAVADGGGGVVDVVAAYCARVGEGAVAGGGGGVVVVVTPVGKIAVGAGPCETAVAGDGRGVVGAVGRDRLAFVAGDGGGVVVAVGRGRLAVVAGDGGGAVIADRGGMAAGALNSCLSLGALCRGRTICTRGFCLR